MIYNSKIYSRLGQSASIFGMSLIDFSSKLPIKVVTADMSVVAGLDRFKSTYPDSFFNVGIAEQNMIGIAAGLADEGDTTVAVAQACFASMRCFEQVRQYMGYMKSPVILVGINSGFSLSFFGNTHYALEDINLMRSISGLTVLSPSDSGEAIKCFEWAIKAKKPTYIRLYGGLNCPIVYGDDFEFNVDKVSKLSEGQTTTIYATGSMVSVALRAADILIEDGIFVNVVNVHTITPLDKEGVLKNIVGKTIFSIEEHYTIGGLGTAISECLSEHGIGCRLVKLGVQNIFMERIGDYKWLLQSNRLTPEFVAEDVKKYV